MKNLIFGILLIIVHCVSFAQANRIVRTNTVTFTADISGLIGVGPYEAFDKSRDTLLVAGLNWDGETTVLGNRVMTNLDTLNPGIYTTTLIINSTLDSVRWKFRAVPTNYFYNAGWETGTDRWYAFAEDGNNVTLPLIVPRILPGSSYIPLTLTINLDMTGSINRYNGLPIPLDEIEFIGIKGTVPFLGNMLDGCWCTNDTSNGSMVILTKINENSWRFEIEVPMGTNSGLYDYKFAVMYSGADTINGGVEPLNNEFSDSMVHNFILVDGPPIVINNIFGDPNPASIKSIDYNPTDVFSLNQNYPNPFNPTTKISWQSPAGGHQTIKLFDLLGREIETIVDGYYDAGYHSALYSVNSSFPSGVYFYRLSVVPTASRDLVLKDGQAGDPANGTSFVETKKMILIK